MACGAFLLGHLLYDELDPALRTLLHLSVYMSAAFRAIELEIASFCTVFGGFRHDNHPGSLPIINIFRDK